MSLLVVVQQSKKSEKDSTFNVYVFVFEFVIVEEFIVETMLLILFVTQEFKALVQYMRK